MTRTIVDRAIDDPAGARRAIYDYGLEIGFPAGRVTGIHFWKAGKEEWAQKLLQSNPAALGLAWQAIEEGRVPPEWNDPTITLAPESAQQTRGAKPMPVMQWRETTLLEPGYYPAQVRSIEEVTGDYGPQLKFTFSILDGDNKPKTRDDGQPLEQWAWCSAKWGSRTKLLQWANVLLKTKCPSQNQPLDTDLLLGKRCDIQLDAKESANGPTVRLVALWPFRSMTANQDDEDEVPF